MQSQAGIIYSIGKHRMILQVAFDFLCINTISRASNFASVWLQPRCKGFLFFLNTKILKYLKYTWSKLGESKPVPEFYYSQKYPLQQPRPHLIRWNVRLFQSHTSAQVWRPSSKLEIQSTPHSRLQVTACVPISYFITYNLNQMSY